MPDWRSALVILVAGVAAAAGGAWSPAHAATPAAGEVIDAPYPLTTALHVPQQAQMVYASGHLFVSEGAGSSQVDVFTTGGRVVTAITGEPGAAGMVVSPDGKTLYVALSTTNKISAIDTTTFAHTELPVDSCPSDVALVAGRLFYSYGCDPGQWTSGVSSIPTSGGTPVAALTSQYSSDLLAGGGSTLAVATADLSPATVSTYAAAANGVVTHLASASETDEVSDMAVAADGSTLYTANPAGAKYTAFDTASLSQAGAYPATAYPTAVALSPDGSHLAGGLNSYQGLVNLYDTASMSTLWKRFGAAESPSTWHTNEQMDQMLAGSLTFASDGSVVYGLAKDGNDVYLFASDLAPSASAVHLSIAVTGSTQHYDATATAPAGGSVYFLTTSNGATTTRGPIPAAEGVAHVSAKSPYSGSVEAAYEGSPTGLPATATRAYTMPSQAKLKLTGFYKSRHGMKLFHTRKAVHALGVIKPPVAGRAVKAVLQVRSGHHWRTASKLTAHTSDQGTFELYLRKAAAHVVSRFELTFKGDSFNSGSQARSATFEIT